MNIQDAIGKGFCCIEISCYIVVNTYFVPKKTNIPHATPIYVHVRSKFEGNCYRQTYCSPEKLADIQGSWKNQVSK